MSFIESFNDRYFRLRLPGVCCPLKKERHRIRIVYEEYLALMYLDRLERRNVLDGCAVVDGILIMEFRDMKQCLCKGLVQLVNFPPQRIG